MNGPVRVVALVGCSAQKLEVPRARARDLYGVSDLFTKAMAWADRFADEAWVVSAAKGLVGPEQEIAHYDQRLPRRKDERLAWARGILRELSAIYAGGSDPLVFVLLAGQDYRLPMVEAAGRTPEWHKLSQRPARFVQLYEGQPGIGTIKAALKESVAEGRPLLGFGAPVSDPWDEAEFRAFLTDSLTAAEAPA